MKINNFSAGPSKIPNEVLSSISNDIKNYKDLGYSVLEISHRSNHFEQIVNDSKKKLIDILNIPEEYEIVFIQGGATFQNTFIPSNNLSLKSNIAFLISGTWGSKTHNDFEIFFNNNVPNYNLHKIALENISQSINESNEEYLYLTSNETIEGVQIRNFEIFNNKKLIVDMSSDICSYKFDWSNLSYVYAGAQKNLGIPGVTICIVKKDFVKDSSQTSYLNINNHITKNSSFNTPPTFSIYVLSKILDWILDSGGIKKIQNDNFIGMNSFGASGPYKDVYKHFNITADNIFKKVKQKLNL